MARRSSLPIHLSAYVEEAAAPLRKWIPREREEDGEEFDPPDWDPELEPNASLSNRAWRRKTEGPDGPPHSGDFVPIKDLGNLADAADVGISGSGGVTWMSELELRAPQMYTLLILILNLEKGETRGMVRSKRRRREEVGHEGRMVGWVGMVSLNDGTDFGKSRGALTE
jgi:hypothetical protein